MRRRPSQPESPLVRLLRDPGGALAHALHLSVQVLEQALPFIAAATGVLLALALALAEVRRRRGRRLGLGRVAGLGQGGGALVRLRVRPATSREQRRLLAVARRLKTGQPARPLARLLDLLDPTPEPPRRPAADPALAPQVREVLA